MLSREFLAFLLIVKMVTSQSVYPTTAVSYSTNSVPTVQTYPASSTVSAVPTVISAMPATVTAKAVTTSAIPATCVTATPMPLSSVTSPTVSVTASPTSTVPKVIGSKIKSETAEPKAYFLPANIPDPKVTILSNDKPGIIEVKPRIYEDTYVDVKPTFCSDLLPSKLRKDVGPMTPVKRMTMACTDDVPTFLNEQPVCPGISKMELTPPPVLKKGGSSKNPIDFEGLFDSFMTCL